VPVTPRDRLQHAKDAADQGLVMVALAHAVIVIADIFVTVYDTTNPPPR
jgi:hypothetical protein